MKKLLLKIWDFCHLCKTSIIKYFWIIFDFFYSHLTKKPVVASVDDTINELVSNRYSIARFGDGEIKLVAGENISFQKATPFVTDKLRTVLSSDVDDLLIGIADIFGDRSRYSQKANKYWKDHLSKYRRVWYKYLIKNKNYYNASMTRQYISLKDHSQGITVYNNMKKIWDNRDVIFIEGEESRLGVGNDLFSNTKSIKRILGPSKQAFDKYEEILEEACKHSKDFLFLIALGPAATALAFDLHLKGYQAIDIGHVDIEYEWLIMNAQQKTPIKNKRVFEASFDEPVEDCLDEAYQSEIIAKIL